MDRPTGARERALPPCGEPPLEIHPFLVPLVAAYGLGLLGGLGPGDTVAAIVTTAAIVAPLTGSLGL